MAKKIISILLALVMVLAIAPVSAFAANKVSSLSVADASISENQITLRQLPFEWEDVKAYTFDGEYAVFLVIESVSGSTEQGYYGYSNVINYKLYYTEDFINIYTVRYTVDTSTYSSVSGAYSLYSPIGADYDTPDEIPYFYDYTITSMGNGKYFINAGAYGDPSEVFSFGAVFADGKVSLVDPEVHGSIFASYDDCYILIDDIMNVTITDAELLSDGGADFDPMRYNLKVAPIYYYSEDGINWTKAFGEKQVLDFYETYVPFEVGQKIGNLYFECDVVSDNILIVRYRPAHPQMMMSLVEYGKVNVTYNGKDFVVLDKIYNAELPGMYWVNGGYIYGMNYAYRVNDMSFLLANMVKYDSEGNIVNEQVLDIDATDWKSAYISSDNYFSFAVSAKNSAGEFLNTKIFAVDGNFEMSVIDTAVDISGIVDGASIENADEEILMVLTNDAIYMHEQPDSSTVYKTALSKKFSDIAVRGSMIFLVADGIYILETEDVISAMNKTSGASDALAPKSDSGITIAAKVAKLTPKMKASAFKAGVENENVTILSKDGKELSDTALVGTGAKVQIKDKNGKVLSEYEVLVKCDVNGDGQITPADARLALRCAAKLEKLEGVYSTAANYDDTGIITPSDARMILRKAAGLEK